MSDTKQDGGPAFPMPAGPEPRVNEATHYNEGMSLRDYFAVHAADGEICYRVNIAMQNGVSLTYEDARYQHADAMLKAREK